MTMKTKYPKFELHLTPVQMQIIIDAMGAYVDNFNKDDDAFEEIEELNEQLCEVHADGAN